MCRIEAPNFEPNRIAENGRLVTLYEMNRFYASGFVAMTSDMGSIETIAERHGQPPFNAEDIAQLKEIFSRMHESMSSVGLDITLIKLDRMISGCDGPVNGMQLSRDVADLRSRMQDELSRGFFLHLSQYESQLYENQEPLGKDVASKLGVSEDAVEAAKCLALGRATACVFHLMRLMEEVLRKWGEKIEVELIDSNGKSKLWQNILDEANKRIREMNQHAAETKAHADISALLYNVKLAWRNEVMHPKSTYTVDEALHLANAVKGFAEHVSKVI